MNTRRADKSRGPASTRCSGAGSSQPFGARRSWPDSPASVWGVVKPPLKSAAASVVHHVHSNGTAAESARFGVVRNIEIKPPPADGATGILDGVHARVRSGVAHTNLRAERQDAGIGGDD